MRFYSDAPAGSTILKLESIGSVSPGQIQGDREWIVCTLKMARRYLLYCAYLLSAALLIVPTLAAADQAMAEEDLSPLEDGDIAAYPPMSTQLAKQGSPPFETRSEGETAHKNIDVQPLPVDPFGRTNTVPISSEHKTTPVNAPNKSANAPYWKDIAISPEYLRLTPGERRKAKGFYFDYWIAERASSEVDDVPALKEQFLNTPDPTPEDVIGEKLKIVEKPSSMSAYKRIVLNGLIGLIVGASVAVVMAFRPLKSWSAKKIIELRRSITDKLPLVTARTKSIAEANLSFERVLMLVVALSLLIIAIKF